MSCAPNEPKPRTPKLRRLLAESELWEIDSAWHQQSLSATRPEQDLPAIWSDSAAALQSWCTITDPSHLQVPGEWPPGSPQLGGVGEFEWLDFGPGFATVCRPFAVSPLSNYVATFWLRPPRNPATVFGVILGTFRISVTSLADDASLLESWLDPATHCRNPIILSREAFANPGEHGLTRLQTRDDGFELWRAEFSTPFFAKACALGLLSAGVQDGAAFAETSVFELSARNALAWSQGNFPSLPDDLEARDLGRRTTLVRRDGESRPALLLTRGSRARCQFPAATDLLGLDLAATIVAEDRLLRPTEQHEESIIVRIGPSGRAWETVLETSLHLQSLEPHFWTEISTSLAVAQPGDWVLELEVVGEDHAMAPLVAFSDPILRYQAEPSPPPNIVLISLDTMRADRLGKLVNGKSLTPHLDDLARRGTWFRNALGERFVYIAFPCFSVHISAPCRAWDVASFAGLRPTAICDDDGDLGSGRLPYRCIHCRRDA